MTWRCQKPVATGISGWWSSLGRLPRADSSRRNPSPMGYGSAPRPILELFSSALTPLPDDSAEAGIV